MNCSSCKVGVLIPATETLMIDMDGIGEDLELKEVPIHKCDHCDNVVYDYDIGYYDI